MSGQDKTDSPQAPVVLNEQATAGGIEGSAVSEPVVTKVDKVKKVSMTPSTGENDGGNGRKKEKRDELPGPSKYPASFKKSPVLKWMHLRNLRLLEEPKKAIFRRLAEKYGAGGTESLEVGFECGFFGSAKKAIPSAAVCATQSLEVKKDRVTEEPNEGEVTGQGRSSAYNLRKAPKKNKYYYYD